MSRRRRRRGVAVCTWWRSSMWCISYVLINVVAARNNDGGK